MQSKTLVFLLLFLAILFYVVKLRTPRRHKAGSLGSFAASENKTSTPNDKLILVTGADYETLKPVLLTFASMYNREKPTVQLQLTTLAEKKFAITFPHDVAFEYFCFCINFLMYPVDSEMKADVLGWATDAISGKKAMYYVPEEDVEHDNVYMTLPDDQSYKIDFSFTEKQGPLPQTIRKYQLPDVDPASLLQLKREMIA